MKDFADLVESRLLKFCLSKFHFQLEYFYKSDFQEHKTHLKSFVSEILFIGGHSLTFYPVVISLKCVCVCARVCACVSVCV